MTGPTEPIAPEGNGEKNEKTPKLHRLEVIEKWVRIVTSLLVIVTIGMGIYQYFQTERLDKKDLSIELINELRTPEFMEKKTILISVACVLKEDKTDIVNEQYSNFLRDLYSRDNGSFNKLHQQLEEDFFFIQKKLNDIGILYDHGLVDKSLINKYVHSEICFFLEVEKFFPRFKKNVRSKTFTKPLESLVKNNLIINNCNIYDLCNIK